MGRKFAKKGTFVVQRSEGGLGHRMGIKHSVVAVGGRETKEDTVCAACGVHVGVCIRLFGTFDSVCSGDPKGPF